MAKIQIKAVVFDLYETLIYKVGGSYSDDPYRTILMTAQQQYVRGRPIFMTEDLQTLQVIAERFGVADKVDFVKCQQELDQRLANTFLYPETIEVLERLKNQGLKLGVISNLSSLYRIPFYNLGLDKYFDQKIFSCEVGLVKPQPEIYQMMVDRLGVAPSQILMTGDQLVIDVYPPQKAGMQAVHLDRKGESIDSIATLEGIFKYL